MEQTVERMESRGRGTRRTTVAAAFKLGTWRRESVDDDVIPGSRRRNHSFHRLRAACTAEPMLLGCSFHRLICFLFSSTWGFSNEPVGERVDAVAVADGACTVLDETALAFQKIAPTLPISLLAKILRRKREWKCVWRDRVSNGML
jgi:hypothetical protein